MNPLILIDTSVVMHEVFTLRKDNISSHSEATIDEISYLAYKAYNSLFFLDGLPEGEIDILWCGDSKEYWRRSYFKDWCKSLGEDHAVNKTKRTRKFKTETEKQFQERLSSGLYTVSNIGYKGNRFQCPQKKLIKNRFTRLTKSLTIKGYEADDVIAAVTKLYPDRKTLIVTVDSDLIQLVSPNVYWSTIGGHYPVLRDEEESVNWLNWHIEKEPKFVRETLGDSLTPRSVVDWKVLRGDSSDTLPPGSPREMIDLYNPPEEHKLWENGRMLECIEESIIKRDETGLEELETLFDRGTFIYRYLPIKVKEIF